MSPRFVPSPRPGAARLLPSSFAMALLFFAVFGLASCGSPRVVGPVDAEPDKDAGTTSPQWMAISAGVFVDFAAAGLRAVGAPCAVSQQCASDLCSVAAGTTCGVCLARRHLGERCDEPLTGCSPSAVCHAGVCQSTKKVAGQSCGLEPKGGDRRDCDDELFCDGQPGKETGICTPRLKVGSSCEDQTVCERGAACLQGVCATPGQDSCALKGCGPGLVCATEDGLRMCRAGTLPRGALCGVVDGQLVAGECEPGTICGNERFPNGGGGPATVTTCVVLPQEGELAVNGQCAEGLFCAELSDDQEGIANRRCLRLHREGESCVFAVYGFDSSSYYSTCASGLECRQGTCQAPCS